MRFLGKFGLLILTVCLAFGVNLLATAWVKQDTLESAIDDLKISVNSNFPDAYRYWDVLTPPPTLVSPLLIRIDKETTLSNMADFDKVGCSGKLYKINIPKNQDAIVTADNSISALEYPIWITGGRNVRVVGIELRPIVQAGCRIGEAHQINSDIPNIHPRLVGAKAFRLQQTGTTYVEGVDIDLAGMEADCFAIRNDDDLADELAFTERHVVIVNTRCTGIEGLDKSEIGDGIHGDFFQNQGRDDIASLILENVTIKSSSNGITMHNWNSTIGQPSNFVMRNVNYGWDPRFSHDDEYEISGLAFTASAIDSSFENVWINHGEGLNYGILNGQRIGGKAEGSYVIAVPGINSGQPLTGDYAKAQATGREYISSFD